MSTKDPNAVTLRPVLEGDTYARTVEGGVRRTPVPADGLLVVMEDREVFIPRGDVQYALDTLEARRRDDTMAKLALVGAPRRGKR